MAKVNVIKPENEVKIWVTCSKCGKLFLPVKGSYVGFSEFHGHVYICGEC